MRLEQLTTLVEVAEATAQRLRRQDDAERRRVAEEKRAVRQRPSGVAKACLTMRRTQACAVLELRRLRRLQADDFLRHPDAPPPPPARPDILRKGVGLARFRPRSCDPPREEDVESLAGASVAQQTGRSSAGGAASPSTPSTRPFSSFREKPSAAPVSLPPSPIALRWGASTDSRLVPQSACRRRQLYETERRRLWSSDVAGEAREHSSRPASATSPTPPTLLFRSLDALADAPVVRAGSAAAAEVEAEMRSRSATATRRHELRMADAALTRDWGRECEHAALQKAMTVANEFPHTTTVAPLLLPRPASSMTSRPAANVAAATGDAAEQLLVQTIRELKERIHSPPPESRGGHAAESLAAAAAGAQAKPPNPPPLSRTQLASPIASTAYGSAAVTCMNEALLNELLA